MAPVETPDLNGAFPRLGDEQIAALSTRGERRRTRAGEVLYREGEPVSDFIVVLEGLVAIVEGDGERELAVHGPGRFLGEVNLLTGQAAFLTAVVREAGAVLVVPLERLREAVAQDARLGDLIVQAYLVRRSLLIELGSGFRIVGSRYDPDTRRLREFAARNRLPHRWLDLERDPQAEALLRELGIGPEDTPVVIWRGRTVLRNPGNAELARTIGLRPTTSAPLDCDLLVVGAGPAGLAAAVYGASEGLATVVLDGVATGGQAGTSSRIENYLGFPSGISGAELAERAVIQARRFGARITVPAKATGLERLDGHHVLRLDDGSAVRALTVLIATGARYRRLDVPRIGELEGISVYYAATWMEAQFCAGDPIVIVGGGNSAGQAAVFLSKHAHRIHLAIRHEDLGRDMSRYLVDQIERIPTVDVLRCTELRELVGGGALEAVVVEDRRTGRRRRLEARALFVFIGLEPHAGWLGGQLAVDERGFVLTGPDAVASELHADGWDLVRRPLPLETSRPGVFAAGDVRSGAIRRVASAVGEGAMAVRMVHEHLEQLGGGHGA
jgi:thioredoxin reductase (NADPH)